MGKFITFGEIMLRLSPNNFNRMLQAKEFNVVYGGAEANVAVSLANFGKEAYFVTRLPQHDLGQAAINELNRYGVNTKYIARGGDRVGIYFYEKGASQRSSKVIYDRAHSAFAKAQKVDFNWQEIFQGAQWFHISGITPALSEEMAAISLQAVQVARELGVTVSMDLNYRKKLWSVEEAVKTLPQIAKNCHLLIANAWDAKNILGVNEGNNDDEKVIEGLAQEFGLKYVATTCRESFSASDNSILATLYDGRKFYKSKTYNLHLVDRVGAGDAFASGLIFGLTSGLENQEALEYAVAASSLKHTIEGDFNLVSVEEVEMLAKGYCNSKIDR